MADSPEAIKKATRTYLKVGAVLFGGTILTVAVATAAAGAAGGVVLDVLYVTCTSMHDIHSMHIYM